MLTIYSDDHRLQDGKAELIEGKLQPCFEMPRRADLVLSRVEEVGLGEVSPPEDFGLAPITRQSGTWQGCATLRQALYMPALVAARFNPDMTAKYKALIDAGKPPKVAITAIMRKLIILANALLKSRRKWQPNIA